MVTIKVTYGPNVHKFTIPVESTWAKFESNLRALFKIPDNFKVIASYTDEDEDIITLSSDIELREVLERHSNYAKTSVKLVLNAIPTSKNITQKEIVETLEGLKIVDDEKCYATETETETEKECDETCNEKCSEEEEETAQSSSDPEIYFFVRSRSRRRPRFGYASFENSSAKCPFRNREFDPHRRHHRQPHGGPFGPFGPHHHGGPHHGGPHHGGPYYGELHHGEPHHRGNRGFHGHPHPPPPPGFMHKRHFGEFEGFGPHGEFGHFGPFGPHHGGHGYGHGHGHGRFRSRRCHGPRCNRETGSEKECHKEEKECKDEKNENVTNDPSVERENHAPSCPPGPSGHAYHGPRSPRRHRSRSRSPVPHDGKEHGNSRMHGHWHGHHPGFHHRRRHHHHHGEVHGHHHHHKQLTPEELAEKVALLNSMNFPADKNEHYENLLKKFHGRIGRVVEILLCERKRKDGEEPGGDNNDGGSDDDDNNDFEEIKEPTSPITSSTV